MLIHLTKMCLNISQIFPGHFSGYGLEKHKFLEKWYCVIFSTDEVCRFVVKLIKKKTKVSVFEKIHKIKNYHHITILSGS